uniref:DNA polymerase n=1 Tax=Podoviridae sp. ctnCN2 TaxID=2825274 RepID=A0A8S5PM34_9CAUD|nr:MAG TPA: DNA polymerase [Podoviridae sp. ctnCN2]
MTPTDLYRDPSKINWGLPIVIDFETYYDKDYSLSKITTEKYIRCDQFEMIGVSIKVGANPTEFYRREEGLARIRELVRDYETSPFISHNSTFDCGILGLRYNIHPLFTVDTVIMAKLSGLDRVAGGKSLSKLSGWMQAKGLVAEQKRGTVHNMLGVHAADMTEQQWQEYGDYCKLDSDLCYALYNYMLPMCQVDELLMSDITTKMWTKPAFDLDVPLLQDYAVRLEAERTEKLSALAAQMGFSDLDELHKHLRSSAKFVALLESLGVECPMKWSEKKKCMIPAVSKTDQEFLALKEHDDELVQLLVETKLGAQSSMEATRTQTLLDIASRGLAPIYLSYAAAHTGRYGGGEKCNWQNLSKRTKEPVLRQSMKAIKGHVVLAVDSSQVECVAGNGLVLTNTGLKQIRDISIEDLLWDGVEWVHHDGVVFKGVKDVITYAGITATPDHVVFTRDGRKLTLDEAAATATPLAIGERNGKAVRALDGAEHAYTSLQVPKGVGAMPMQERVFGSSERFARREIKMLSFLSHAKIHRYSRIAREAVTRALQRFSRTGKGEEIYQPDIHASGKSVFFLRSVCPVYVGDFSYAGLSGFGDRPYRQYRALRAGEYPTFDERGKRATEENKRDGAVSGQRNVRKQVLQRLYSFVPKRCSNKVDISGCDARRNNSARRCTDSVTSFIWRKAVQRCRVLQEFLWKKIRSTYHDDTHGARYTKRGNLIVGTIEVFDIVNAGSRNRFCYNGIIVSNCRANAVAADQKELIDLFIHKGDPYVYMATEIFMKPYDVILHDAKVDKTKEGKKMRDIGKKSTLSCGYGMSSATFKTRMLLEKNEEAAAIADDIVAAYRRKNDKIVQFWKDCGRALDCMYAGQQMWFGGADGKMFFADGSSQFNGVTIPSIKFPNGTYLWYQNLRKDSNDEGKTNYVFDMFKGRGWQPTRIWGSKLTENIIQKLSFDILKWQALEIAKAGVPINLNVHDEWVSVVPERDAAAAAIIHCRAMKTSPPWFPQGVLDCEVDVGRNYGKLVTIHPEKYL